jgi:uncharacterized lipoprotein YddW (UPF0748 family)
MAGVAAPFLPACSGIVPDKKSQTFLRKNWIWIHPRQEDEEKELEEFYKKCRDSGVHGLFLLYDSEKHFRIAKSQGLEAHRWILTMQRSEKEMLEKHPDWYTINRKGESCVEKPPYINSYRWLCPSREDVRQFVADYAMRELQKDYVDGMHLDYVRYCDVILPVDLWSRYGLVQTSEMPEYDFCYCNTCKTKFREWSGQDPDAIEYPQASSSWLLYRYHSLTTLVNRVAKEVKTTGKPLTAAVFPTPEIARRLVRQDWINWDLDGIFPMIYNGYYGETVKWIGHAVAEGVRGIDGRFPLYAGIHLPQIKDDRELADGMQNALDNGAAGICLFGKVSENALKVLQEIAKP